MRTTSILWCGLVMGCGGGGAGGPATKVVPAPSAASDGFASLPAAVVGLVREPRELLAPSHPMREGMLWTLPALGRLALEPCWAKLYGATSAWYRVVVAGQELAHDERPVYLLRAAWTPEEVACLVADDEAPVPSPDPRIHAWRDVPTEDLDEDGAIDEPTPRFAVAWLDDGWIGVGREGADLAPLLARGDGAHPLRPLVERPFATATWAAFALDFTGELLGVPSLGARVSVDDLVSGGQVEAELLFADAAAAEQALVGLRGFIAQAGPGPGLVEYTGTILAGFERVGTIAIEGNAITYRGTFALDQMVDARRNAFVTLARPLSLR